MDVDPGALAAQIEGRDAAALEELARALREEPLPSNPVLREALSAARRRQDGLMDADRSAPLGTALARLVTAIQKGLAAQRVAARRDAARSAAAASPLRRGILDELAMRAATPTDLAQRLKRSKEAVSRDLSALRNAGIVAVEGDVEDGRKRVYALTAAGEAHAADALVFTDPSEEAAPPAEPAAAPIEGILVDALTAAVSLRRRSTRRNETLARLRSIHRGAVRASAPMVAVEALQETIVTLRQAGRPQEAVPHLDLLARIAGAHEADYPPATMVPALGFLEYELGRRPDDDLCRREGHLTTASFIFSRLAQGEPEGHWSARQAWAHASRADNLRQQSRLGDALLAAYEARKLFEACDDTYGIVRATFLAGFCLRLRGQFTSAAERLEQAYKLAHAEGYAAFSADALMQLGEVRRCQGDPETAGEMLSEALEAATRLELPLTRAFAQSALAATHHDAGRDGEALEQLSVADTLFETHRHEDGLALNHRRQAVVLREAEEHDRARDHLVLAKDYYKQLRSPAGLVACEVEFGNLALAQGRAADDACRELQALVDLPTSRRMLELDPWVPALVFDLAERIGHDDLTTDAKCLIQQHEATLQEHVTEATAEVTPLRMSDIDMSVLPSRRPDPMAGEPRRVHPPAPYAMAA